ncbi:cell envelope integrity protein TolA [Micromonospora radicis]|uniref:cell envelope integrity protein TolA n=1 Tax=Micromonospora radicis TaxID=1894971 RepID=UPI0011C47935|nr:cell envelope integrity protein TolA [Micromonospora radicis]
MQRWDSLNERQLDLLRRINGGDDLSGPDGVVYRRSARALQDRNLVTVTRKAGVWRACSTDAGRFYLEHGHHPDHPDHRASLPRSDEAPAPGGIAGGASSADLLRSARVLLDRLQHEGGMVRIESPDSGTRARYRRIIHAFKQQGLVPAGHHLRHTGRDAGDIVIRLYTDAGPDETDWNRIRLNTRRVTTDAHLAFSALEADPTNLAVSPDVLPRALLLIRQLAGEAARRGHRLGVNTKAKHPRMFLQSGQVRRTVTLTEERDQVPHEPTAEELKMLRLRPWMKPPNFDVVDSGRLRLEITRAGHDNRDTWTDTPRVRLEQRVAQIIQGFEAGVTADEQQRQAAEAAREKATAEHRRRQEEAAAERRRQEEATLAQWHAAMADARVQAADKIRAETFRNAYQAWTTAAGIRAFCTALEQAAEGRTRAGGYLASWVAWGRAAADRIDPTRNPRVLADINYNPEPGPDDLRPFLGDWSPHGPRKEHRPDHNRQAHAGIHRQAESWHHGLLDHGA